MMAVSGLVFLLGLSSGSSAATRIGELRCNMQPGPGYVIGSVHLASCVFVSESGRRERYWGRIRRAGLDIGYTSRARLVWEVFAPSMLGPRALAGDYVGVSADAAIGTGGGANVLVGGNAGTISLQPLSLKRELGFALAAGAGVLELR
jgi:Protein of unknown function (DUF992)